MVLPPSWGGDELQKTWQGLLADLVGLLKLIHALALSHPSAHSEAGPDAADSVTPCLKKALLCAR